MAKFTMNSDVMKEGSLFRIAEFKTGEECKTVTIGRSIRSTYIYHVAGREAKMAEYNRAINLYEDWQKDKLSIYTNKEKSKIYMEIQPGICIDETRHAFEMSAFAEKTSEDNWNVYFSYNPPVHIQGYVISAIGAVVMNLFSEEVCDSAGAKRENHPAFFCDAIYNGFVRKNSFEGEVISADAISEKFAAADLSSIFEVSYTISDSEDDSEEDSSDGYWTWESCLKGEHRLDYDWAPEARENIPSLEILNAFIPTAEFMRMLAITEYCLGNIQKRMAEGAIGEEAIGNDSVNLKLAGPPGSGKSFALKCMAAVLGMPFWVTSFNPNSDESFAEGKTRMVGSEPKHTDAPLTLCQMYGGISAGEEPNTGDPEMIFGVYSQIVESPYTLYRNGCEAVVRHPLAVYAILYNKNCGSATMHPALLNRFNQPFKFEAASKEEFIKMLLKHTSGASTSASYTDMDTVYKDFNKRRKIKRPSKTVCEWVYKAYNCVINSLDTASGRDAAEAISLRSCMGLLKAIEAGEDPQSALRCLIDNVGDFDDELELAIKKALSDTMRKL